MSVALSEVFQDSFLRDDPQLAALYLFIALFGVMMLLCGVLVGLRLKSGKGGRS